MFYYLLSMFFKGQTIIQSNNLAKQKNAHFC